MAVIFKPRRIKRSTGKTGSKKTLVLSSGELLFAKNDTSGSTGRYDLYIGDGSTTLETLKPSIYGDTSEEDITITADSSANCATALGKAVSGATLSVILGALKQAIAKLNDDKAATNHTHSGYASSTHNHDTVYWKRTEKVSSATVADSANAVTWNNISGKPSTYTPGTHNHDGTYVRINGSDTMTGDLRTPNISLEGGNQYIYGGDYGSGNTNHALQIGSSGRDYWSFYEYGGDFRFYKSRSNNNTLVGKISENGFEGNTNGVHTGSVNVDGSNDGAFIYSENNNINFRYKYNGTTSYMNTSNLRTLYDDFHNKFDDINMSWCPANGTNPLAYTGLFSMSVSPTNQIAQGKPEQLSEYASVFGNAIPNYPVMFYVDVFGSMAVWNSNQSKWIQMMRTDAFNYDANTKTLYINN